MQSINSLQQNLTLTADQEKIRMDSFQKNYTIQFSKPITEDIYIKVAKVNFNTLIRDKISIMAILWSLDPTTAVPSGKYQGCNSLMLACILAAKISNNVKYKYSRASNIVGIIDLALKKENIKDNLNELIYNILNYPGIDINATCTGQASFKGQSVLWIAVATKQRELANKLFEAGADINATCSEEGYFKGVSVLWQAAANKDWELVAKLIHKGADVNAICTGESNPDKGISIFSFAAINYRLELISILINKANINTLNFEKIPNEVAIYIAILRGHIDTVNLLLADKSDRLWGNNLIMAAIEYENTKILKLLLTDGRQNSKIADDQAIRYAAARGYIKGVKLLLRDKRVNPAAQYNQAILDAAINEHIAVVKLLLKNKRVNPLTRDYKKISTKLAKRFTKFLAAAANGLTPLVEEYLKKKGNPALANNIAVIIAATNGHTEVVSLLIKYDMVNLTAMNNRAICMACTNGHANTVELLLTQGGINPTVEDNRLILIGSVKGHASIVKLLLTYEKVKPAPIGNDPLKYAVAGGHTEVVKLLLIDNRVNPAVWCWDNEILTKAVANGHIEILKLLIVAGKGRNPTAANKALVMAFEKSYNESLMASKATAYTQYDTEKSHMANAKRYLDIVKVLFNNANIQEIIDKELSCSTYSRRNRHFFACLESLKLENKGVLFAFMTFQALAKQELNSTRIGVLPIEIIGELRKKLAGLY